MVGMKIQEWPHQIFILSWLPLAFSSAYVFSGAAPAFFPTQIAQRQFAEITLLELFDSSLYGMEDNLGLNFI